MSLRVLILPIVLLFVQITVDCIENIPPVDLVLGEHVFLSVGDFRTKSQ